MKNFLLLFTISLIGFFGNSCSSKSEVQDAKFKLDHIVIFTKDSTLEERLKSGLLNYGEKLASQHKYQGTLGHYFIFYNSFIEFLYLEDSLAAIKNEDRFKSKYSQRWQENVKSCPFGFGLTLSPFDSSKTDFQLVAYKSLDAPVGEYYLMSESNTDQKQPLLYVSSPNRAYSKIERLADLDSTMAPEIRADFENYLSHPSGIKELTGVTLTIPADAKGINIGLLQSLEGFTIDYGKEYALGLTFDEGKQGKEFNTAGSLKLRINY